MASIRTTSGSFIHGTVPQSKQIEIISHNMCTIITPKERKLLPSNPLDSGTIWLFFFHTACKSLTPAVVVSEKTLFRAKDCCTICVMIVIISKFKSEAGHLTKKKCAVFGGTRKKSQLKCLFWSYGVCDCRQVEKASSACEKI